MKKYLFILSIIQLISTTALVAQTGKISGKIIDKKTGETLPGASVLIEGTVQGASSDFDGNYIITSVKPGKYNVICKYVSYANKLIKDIYTKIEQDHIQQDFIKQKNNKEIIKIVEEIKNE